MSESKTLRSEDDATRPPAAVAGVPVGVREMELLVQAARCAAREPGPADRARVRELARAGLDAGRLVRLAVYHKMAPLLYRHLEPVAGEPDPAIPFDALRSFCTHNAGRMLRLTGELVALSRTFEERGILAVPYKGPALGQQLYGNLTLRQSVDLDLVVRRSNARRARELLIECGYRPRHPLSEAGVAFMIDHRYHEAFVGPRAAVELHWAFTNRDVGFPLDLDALAPALRRLRMGGHPVNAFAPADLLLLLCVHGAKHRWDRLEWLCGAAELVRSGEVDTVAAVERASRLGVRRMALLGFQLAHDLLNAPLPSEVRRHVQSDPGVGRLARGIAGELRAGAEPNPRFEPVERDLFHLQLRERLLDRVRFLWHRITTPSDPDRWATVGIGGHYLRLHAVFRPWTVVAKLMALVHRRLGGRRPARPAGANGAMRILQVVQRPQRRGAEIFAHQLSAALRREGHEVAIAYLYPNEDESSVPLGSDDRLLQGEEEHPLETLIGVRPALLWRLRRTIREFEPEIIQVNGARTVKYGTLANWLRARPTGAVIYRNIGTPQDWIRGIRRKLFYRAILRKIDGVVALSEDNLAALEPTLGPATERTVISNAVDPDALRPAIPRDRIRGSAATPLDAPVALFLGSLSPEKRVDRLIDAVGQARSGAPDLHLWIVGGGPLRAELEARTERAGLQDVVRFFGVQSDVASYLAAADLLALTSDTEGVPGVVLEAGCLGRPVVATRVGAVPELVIDGETGLLVEPGDDDALADALARLAADAGLRERLGARARERVLARHTIERIAQEYVRFYREVYHRAGWSARADV